MIEPVSLFAVSSFSEFVVRKAGTKAETDAPLRRSRPSMTEQPIMPTPTMTPAGRHGVAEEEAWPPAGTQPMEVVLAPWSIR
jgi:hypothetical protein